MGLEIRNPPCEFVSLVEREADNIVGQDWICTSGRRDLALRRGHTTRKQQARLHVFALEEGIVRE